MLQMLKKATCSVSVFSDSLFEPPYLMPFLWYISKWQEEQYVDEDCLCCNVKSYSAGCLPQPCEPAGRQAFSVADISVTAAALLVLSWQLWLVFDNRYMCITSNLACLPAQLDSSLTLTHFHTYTHSQCDTCWCCQAFKTQLCAHWRFSVQLWWRKIIDEKRGWARMDGRKEGWKRNKIYG